jgi:hypothetical protein
LSDVQLQVIPARHMTSPELIAHMGIVLLLLSKQLTYWASFDLAAS